MNPQEIMVKCAGCGKSHFENALTEYLQEFENGTVHVRGECPSCGRYIKYIPYSKSKTVSMIIRLVNLKKYENIESFIKRHSATDLE